MNNLANMPFGTLPSFSELDTVPPLAQLIPQPGIESPNQGPWEELLQLRQQFPNLVVLPWFNSIVGLVCTAQNTPYDLKIPDNASVGMFFSSTGFFVTDQGGARSPTGADTPFQEYNAFSMYSPVNQLFYIKGKKEFSISSPSAGCIVTLGCYITRNIT